MPHTGRAQIGPVTSTMAQKTTPTSAETSASTSVSGCEKRLRIKNYQPDTNGSVGGKAIFAGTRSSQILSGCDEVDEEQAESRPRRRHVVVKNTLHLAH